MARSEGFLYKGSLARGSRVLALGDFDQAPVDDYFQLPRLDVLLREDGGEHVVGLLGRTLLLFLLLLLVQLGMPWSDPSSPFRQPCSFRSHLQLLLYYPDPVELPSLLLLD